MRTIRSKITLLYVLIFGFTLSIFSAALYLLYARQSAQNFDLNLSNDALAIVDFVKGDGLLEQEIISNLLQRPVTRDFGTNRYVQVISISGNIIIKSSNLKQSTLPVSIQVLNLALSQHQVFETLDKKFTKELIGSGNLRLVTYPVFDNGIPRYLVQVASSTQPLDESLLGLRILLFIAVPLTILAAALGGFYIAKKAFDPIDRIIRTAQSISAEHLDKRLEAGNVDDEVTRLSRTLNEMIDRIEGGFKIQKQFTTDASHELRTPLTILLGEIEVALKNPRTPEEYQAILRSSVEEIRRITNIVDELLTIARLEGGQLQLAMKPLRLDELLLDAVSRTSAYASQRSITINFEISTGSSGEGEEIFVNGDRDKLLSVFINLLDNAIKYSHDNSMIRVVETLEENHAIIKIVDSGIGISEEDLPHVFDRFYRADKSRSAEGTRRGSGLGLSISRSLIEAHGGKMTIQSHAGGGTAVAVSMSVLRNNELTENQRADSFT
ncbi:MAG TPA: ATP-binding protein [Candidatus Kryptonia bacterium]